MGAERLRLFRSFRAQRVYIAKKKCYNSAMLKQIAAFDIGDKRIGVAFSDPFGEYAVPSDTYFRTGDFKKDVSAIAEIAASRSADLIVCGLPVNADGTESVQTQKTRRFIEALSAQAGVPVVTEDERYTTRAARGDLLEMGVSAKKDKRKKSVDSLAAAYILESYLAGARRSKEMKEVSNDYEDGNNIVELMDDDGNTMRFEHVMSFQYKDEMYCALTPETEAEEGDEDEGAEVAIYHITGDEGDEYLETIDDEQFLDEVFAEFCRLYEDFEDADEAEELEPDADDE